MRHNQNARRGGRNNRGGGHHHSSQQHGNNGNRRINPRVHTFDSNGPDVRIRGTAYQICEKYAALARDAASAGDRVLAESYLQYAEHYQRFINEAMEEFNQYQQQHQQQPVIPADAIPGNGADDAPQPVLSEQPSASPPLPDGDGRAQPRQHRHSGRGSRPQQPQTQGETGTE